jgi:oligosaccharide repeat unit polymerase
MFYALWIVIALVPIVLCLNLAKLQGRETPIFIIVMYGVSALLGQVLLPESQENLFLGATVLFMIGIAGALLPLVSTNSNLFMLRQRHNGELRHLRIFSNYLIGIGCFACIYYAGPAKGAFVGNVAENRVIMLESSTSWQQGYTNAFAAFAAYHSPLMVALGIMNLAVYRDYRRGTLLLIASTSYLFYVTARAGRDGFVFWIFSLIVAFLVYRKKLLGETRMYIAVIVAPIAVVALGVFAVITRERFGVMTEVGERKAVTDYALQSFGNLNNLYDLPISEEWGKLNLPVIYKVLSILKVADYEVMRSLDYRRELIAGMGYDPNRFTTYFGSWVLDFGWFGATALCCFIGSAIYFALRMNRRRSLIAAFILYTAVANYLCQGLFYNTYSSDIANCYILAILLYSTIFTLTTKTGALSEVACYRWRNRLPVQISSTKSQVEL